MDSLYDVSSGLDTAERQRRRELMRWAFGLNEESVRPYLEEAFYLVAVHLALQLQRQGQFLAALDWLRTVYDYSVEPDQRKIYFGLAQEESLAAGYERSADWLLDPLDPHRVAATRRNAHTRFTLLTLARCLLDYADAEFTRDTAESVPRARVLYTTALEILGRPELPVRPVDCDALIGALEIEVDGLAAEWIPAWREVKSELRAIHDRPRVERVVEQVRTILRGSSPAAERIAAIRQVAAHARGTGAVPRYAGLLSEADVWRRDQERAVLARPEAATAVEEVGRAAEERFVRDLVASVPSLREEHGGRDPVPIDLELAAGALDGLRETGGYRPPGFRPVFVPRAARVYSFCIPPNPVVEALRLRAELNLYKIRTCRNIAGVERPIDPYAAPTDTVSGLPQIGASGQLVLPGTASLLPTPYRYSTLIERAKQLVQIAALVEASMLSAFEKRDAELYNLLRARQDVQLARQGVRLQRLRIREAEHGVDLAELQEERAQLQVDHYAELLEAGLSALEQQALVLMTLSAGLQLNAAMASFLAATLPSGFGQFGIPQYSPQAAAGAVASGLSSLAGMASTTASILSTYASYERRAQEWEFQRQLSQKDVRIAAQQVNLAQDHVRIVGQEHEIAQLQADHAQETLDFLSSKFTNVELYDWMSGVLSGVYGYFLQQATAMARLAEQQLAFERQEVPPAIVQADYWAPPAEGLEPASDGGPDRSGLTGSARLLRDIHQLDQHAFETDKRKLQLTKTISLARLAPIEFERFRSSGVMRFDTPLPLFDRDFPGHYLRLIKRVRTSVVALVPPTEGVRATLSSLGSSRVVIGGDVFQTIVVRRPPESVALSSPRDATGLFELQSPPEMLLPFEGLGVDTSWEFRMPRAANACDYATIADVLLTLEYTALDSFTYREQVVRLLGDTISADRPFSFRHQFADAWYDLNNPSDPAAPRLTASFEMGRRDFPTNLSALRIQQVAVFFAGPDGGPVSAEIRGVELRFTESRTGERRHGAAVDSRGGIVSTRRGGAASWVSAFLDGREPTGTWEIDLPASVLPSLRGEAIQDILFVVTYSAQTPAWSA
jgi:hypothetical protein